MSRVSDDLRAAADVGIADIAGGRFRSFDNPIALDQYLQELAAGILGDESSALSVRIPDEASKDCKPV
jgi:hypothetical protein